MEALVGGLQPVAIKVYLSDPFMLDCHGAHFINTAVSTADISFDLSR